jgi:hypothetical protein
MIINLLTFRRIILRSGGVVALLCVGKSAGCESLGLGDGGVGLAMCQS